MTAYLVENPPLRSQYRKPRRAVPTGTCVLHSFEIAPDLTGEDVGAERGASIIQGRTDRAGSYHLLGDRDSQILLVPLDWEAFHDGTGSNPWSIGLSLAVTAAWFRQAPDDQKLWYVARLATMARTASDWLQANHGITVPARRLTKASATEAGFCTHMDRETWFGTPGRRSDPWGNSDAMWHLFLTLYQDTANSAAPEPSVPQEDDDMPPPTLAWLRETAGKNAPAHCYRIDGNVASWMPDHPHIGAARFLGAVWWGGAEQLAFVDPVLWQGLAIMNGPLANLALAKASR